jgi:WD40 repeat protein
VGDLTRPGEVKVWDRELWEPRSPIRGTSPWIYSPTGRLLATGPISPKGPREFSPSPDAILLWDTTTRTIRHTLRLVQGHKYQTWRFSPDERLLAGVTADKKLVLWDLETGKPRGLFEGHSQTVLDVRISLDARTVVSTQMAPFPAFIDPKTGKATGPQVQEGPSVMVWDLPTRALRATLTDAYNPRFIVAGQRLLTVEKGKFLVIREAATGKELSRFPYGDGSIDSLHVSPYGEFAVLGLTRIVDTNRRSEIRCFDLTTGQQTATFPQPDWDLQTLAITPDSRFVISSHGRAVNEGGTVKVWDLEQPRLVRSWRAHQNAFKGLAVSPDGTRLVTAGGTEVKVWDLVTYQELIALPGVSPVYFFPDSRSLLSESGGDVRDFRVWRAATHEEVKMKPDR